MMRRLVLPFLLMVAVLSVPAAAYAAPADRVACETANADVLIKAVAVVNAATQLAASDNTISATLLDNVKAAGVAVDKAVAVLKALPADAPPADRAAAQAALIAAQKQLQDATTALNNAASSPALVTALTNAKSALSIAIDNQTRVCRDVTPPTTTVTPPPTTTIVTPPPNTTIVVPPPVTHTLIPRIPTGSVATGVA